MGRFDLNHDLVIDQDVEAVGRELLPLKEHRYAHLAADAMSFGQQYALESHHVNVLSKSEVQLAIDIVTRADDRICQLFFDVLHAPLSIEGRPNTSSNRRS